MNSPLISIITVVYNASETLEHAINSVLSQDDSLFEYWIIDGGSTDGSVEIIKGYESKLAGWLSEPDQGIYDAMNKGIDRANGKWLYFLGADDFLYPNVLSLISTYLKPDLCVVYGNVRLDTGYLVRPHIGIRCLFENRLHHQSAFYNRHLFDEFRYKQKFRVCADYELTLRVYLQKRPSLHLPIVISVFATNGTSHVLTSNDINEIRGLYIKKPYLNTVFSFMIDTYYVYFRAKMIVKQKIQRGFATVNK